MHSFESKSCFNALLIEDVRALFFKTRFECHQTTNPDGLTIDLFPEIAALVEDKAPKKAFSKETPPASGLNGNISWSQISFLVHKRASKREVLREINPGVANVSFQMCFMSLPMELMTQKMGMISVSHCYS